MAETVVTPDQMALRRRARRRLAGAVAIALTSFLVLPMLFDSEPKPLGPDVEIHIPAQNTPFEPAQPVLPRAPLEHEIAKSEPLPAIKSAEPTQSIQPARPVTPVPAIADKPVAAISKPVTPEQKPNTVVSQPAEKPLPKPEPKPPLKPDQTFAAQGYFLQLGAFTNESNARQLYEKVKAAGFNVVLVTTHQQFRVRVGPIPQHDKALEMQARLKTKGFSPVLLGP